MFLHSISRILKILVCFPSDVVLGCREFMSVYLDSSRNRWCHENQDMLKFKSMSCDLYRHICVGSLSWCTVQCKCENRTSA